eukprot:CAMPEP_0118947078 /NCGR_PEP_ID=MMETSP1169-20130426/45330_1 /TAXON_ID=36882 /ORGANISM="Pyramimonas obovata, Strain CCMP722" /LENGTH=48 /DNA_ID= /DNA_START= /DNA_END= /DNA_ORIENTATION=
MSFLESLRASGGAHRPWNAVGHLMHWTIGLEVLIGRMLRSSEEDTGSA